MKELENPNFLLQPKILKVAEQQKEYKKIGSMKIKPGQKLWQYNTKTDEITEVKMNAVEIIDIKKQKGTRSKVIIDINCYYTTALNKTNAEKKFLKMMIEILKNKNGTQ